MDASSDASSTFKSIFGIWKNVSVIAMVRIFGFFKVFENLRYSTAG
jgi:hypothetical protein